MKGWHGYKALGRTLFVGPLPGRKSICLWMEQGGAIHVLAFFKSEELAREALQMLDLVARGDVKR